MEPNLTDVNVEEIMKKIRVEVAKRKRCGVTRPPDKNTTVLTEVHKPIEPPMKKTKLYVFAKWLGQKMKRLGFGNVVSRGKKLMPEGLKYNISFLPDDFTKHHDEEFIEKAYRGILKRNPDPHGLDYFLSRLRRGKLNKTEVLGRIRYSKEGRKKRVKIKGLLFPFLLNTFYKVPVAGYILRIITAFARLPVILRDVHEYEAFTNSRFTTTGKTLGELSSRIETNVLQLTRAIADKPDSQVLNEIRNDLAKKADVEGLAAVTKELGKKVDVQLVNEMSDELSRKIDIQAAYEIKNEIRDELFTKVDLQMVEEIQEMLSKKADIQVANEIKNDLTKKMDMSFFDEIKEGLADKAALLETRSELNNLLKESRHQKSTILDQHRMLALLLEEIRSKLPGPTSKKRIEKMLGEKYHLLDALYVTFEDEFRGVREQIKEKQRIYLSYVESVNAAKGTSPILDLGCGRGEWLELLKENGFTAKGVDINRVMVQQCQNLGLDVSESDMIEYLRHQRAHSFRTITGFHIVEHLPLKTLISLFDESFRVLKPGGTVIFETPNPENLIVSVCNFYFDPTHNKPIPPKLLKFLVEARGFVNAEIIRLHPYKFFSDKTKTFEGMEEVIQLFEKEQDYSVIAYKM